MGGREGKKKKTRLGARKILSVGRTVRRGGRSPREKEDACADVKEKDRRKEDSTKISTTAGTREKREGMRLLGSAEKKEKP